MAAPDDFNNVPASPTELTLQLLNNLTVTPDRPIKALKIAVNNEDQVFKFFTPSKTDSAQSLWLITLTVTEEGPDFTAFTRHEPTRREVTHKVRLINRL